MIKVFHMVTNQTPEENRQSNYFVFVVFFFKQKQNNSRFLKNKK